METNQITQRVLNCWQKSDAPDSNDARSSTAVTSERQQPVKNQKAQSTDNIIHCVSANPLQMKTQIAKLSYSPTRSLTTTKKEKITKAVTSRGVNTVRDSTPPSSPAIAEVAVHTKEEFERRKNERHQEVQEIQSLLDKIAAPSARASAHSIESQEYTGRLKLVRSKTDGQIQHTNKAASQHEQATGSLTTTRARSKSTQRLATKPQELPSVGVKEKEKKKSYDPQEARQFMEEQKKKRRLQSIAAAQAQQLREKSPFDKDEIKKRLEDLRKNSRKIVSKNVSKKLATKDKNPVQNDDHMRLQKIVGSVQAPEIVQTSNKPLNKTSLEKGKTGNEQYEVSHLNADIKHSQATSITDKQQDANKVDSKHSKSTEISNLPQSANKTDIKRSKTAEVSNAPLGENQKHIGLLRKPECKDHSFSAIKEFSFDKENVALEMLTPKLQVIATESSLIGSKHENIVNEAFTTKGVLEAKSAFTEEAKESEVDPNAIKKINDLPYWLKPSPIQIYPYNFIMAVRHKLEAISDPVKSSNASDASIHKAGTGTTYVNSKELRISSRCLESKESNEKNSKEDSKHDKDAIVHREPGSYGIMSASSCATHTIARSQSRSVALKEISLLSPELSDLNSNFSSASIQVPISNSISDAFSLKLSSVHNMKSDENSVSEALGKPTENDDTTISSSVFSSPKKRYDNVEMEVLSYRSISPLSLENIDGLQITSHRKLKKAIKANYVSTDRGDFTKRLKENCESVTFSKLLDDFNRSLSQVIQVNEKLKNSLGKSHSKPGLEKDSTTGNENDTKSTTRSVEYTADFEKFSNVNASENVKLQKTDVASCVSTPRTSGSKRSHCEKSEAQNIIKENRMDREQHLKSDFSSKDMDMKNRARTTDYVDEKGPETVVTETKDATYRRRDISQKSSYTQNSEADPQISEHLNIESKNSSSENTKSKQSDIKESSDRVLHHSCSTLSNKVSVKCEKENNNYEAGDVPISEQISYHHETHNIRGDENSARQNLFTDSATESSSNSVVAPDTCESAIALCQTKKKHSKLISSAETNSSSNVSRAPPSYDFAISTDVGVISKFRTRRFMSDNRCIELTSNTKKTINPSSNKYSGVNSSALSPHSDSVSESSNSYTSIGLYERLIHTEESKTEHFTLLLKMREKALLDRTKGQIAWLEVQKEHYKSKGLHDHLAAIRKKQRGILLKMEKERENIKKLLQSTQSSSKCQTQEVTLPRINKTQTNSSKHNNWRHNSPSRHTASATSVSFREHPVFGKSTTSFNLRSSVTATASRSAPIVRAAYDIESSSSLEKLLLNREADLQRRRQHVEQLMQWHQRLNKEEDEIVRMERALFNYNNINHQQLAKRPAENSKAESESESVRAAVTQHTPSVAGPQRRMERRVKKINDSLRELNSISPKDSDCVNKDASGSERTDFVYATGKNLNKLWRRLTSQHVEKFEINKSYKLYKSDLEQLYEDAKIAVLQEFSTNEDQIATKLLDRSLPTSSNSNATNTEEPSSGNAAVPPLNLNCSSEQSEDTSATSLTREKYSSCDLVAEFRRNARSQNTDFLDTETKELKAVGVNRNMSLLDKSRTDYPRLRRSHSDPQIMDLPLGSEHSLRVAISQDSVVKSEISRPSYRRAEGGCDDNNKCEPAVEELSVSSAEKSARSTDHKNEDSTCSDHTVPSNTSANAPPSFDTLTTSSRCLNRYEINEPETESGNRANETQRSENLIETKSQSTDANNLHQNSIYELNSIVSAIYSECPSENLENSELCDVEIPSTTHSPSNEISTLKPESAENSKNSTPESYDSLSFCYSGKEKNYLELVNTANSSENRTGMLLMSTNQTDCENPSYESDFENNNTESLIDKAPHMIDTNDASETDSENVRKTGLTTIQPRISSKTSVDSAAGEQGSGNTEELPQLMPDIINELEKRRCRQTVVENEAQPQKQYEQVAPVPYMYVREIPNKPPPPYVPPAHGSPMTTIFPSEERIRDITYRRSREIYCEILNKEYTNESGEQLPSVLDEKITNIYERIILDICREYLEEHKEMLINGDPGNFYSSLAFFNPPDRLRCIQESIYKEVRRCLAMDKTSPKRTQVYSVYGQRAKRDHIGKIITQEMYNEDDKWSNFQREEIEVLEMIVDEMVANLIKHIAEKVLVEEGGTFEAEGENADEHLNEKSLQESCQDSKSNSD